MKITTYTYVLVRLKTQHASFVIHTIMHTVQHLHKPNWKCSEDWGKLTVSHGKNEETAIPQSLCVHFWLEKPQLSLRWQEMLFQLYQLFYMVQEQISPIGMNSAIFFKNNLIGNRVNLIWHRTPDILFTYFWNTAYPNWEEIVLVWFVTVMKSYIIFGNDIVRYIFSFGSKLLKYFNLSHLPLQTSAKLWNPHENQASI